MENNREVNALKELLLSKLETMEKHNQAALKHLDDVRNLFYTRARAYDSRIEDLSTRINKIETRGQAYSTSFGVLVTAIGLMAAVLSAIVAVFFKNRGSY